MGRLIDADLLKKNCKCTGEFEDFFKCVSLSELAKVIDNQPTVFDVDKVIEQLKRKESVARSELLVDRKTAFEFSSKCRLEAYEEAIEIVKGGGTE